jgi:sulfate transport system ATP-binding protein
VLHVGDHHLPVDNHELQHGAEAVAFARPHDLEIERFVPGGSGIPATIKRILAIGPNARVELQTHPDERLIEVEIPRTRLKALGLVEGEEVVVKAKNVRLFPHKSPAG